MTEPATSVKGGSLLLAALIAAMGPLLAEWVLIVLGGFIGSFLAVTALETLTFRGAAIVLARGVGMSALFTASAAALAAPHIGATVDLLLLPMAGLIGWQQDRLLSMIPRFPAKKDIP